MGETAKILNPEKRVLMPDLDATCSLDLGCPADDFPRSATTSRPRRGGVRQHQRRGEGARRLDGDLSIAVEIVGHLHEQGKKILWAPDKHLGDYVQEETGADMLMWNGSCVVHDEFKGRSSRS